MRLSFNSSLIIAFVFHVILLTFFVIYYDRESNNNEELKTKRLRVQIGNDGKKENKPSNVKLASKPKPPVEKKFIKQDVKKTEATINIPEEPEEVAVKLYEIDPVIVFFDKKIKQEKVPLPEAQNKKKYIGEKDGNRQTVEQKTIENYQQKIGLWIERHKSYPDEALARKLNGQTLVHLKVHKSGQIVDYKFIKKSNHRILDNAIIKMIESSNPLPPFPSDYPNVEHDEFIVPIDISYKKDS